MTAILLTACSHSRLTPEVVLRSQSVSHSSTFMAEIEGSLLSFGVTDADLSQTPKWGDPATTVPPLSIAEAIAVANPEVSRYVADASRWRLSEVALHSLGNPGSWFYVVSYRLVGDAPGDRLPIPILFSGKPVIGSSQRPRQ